MNRRDERGSAADVSERPRPAIDADSAPWWAAAARHELTVQRCATCGDSHFPPETACPACGGYAQSLVPVAGTGTLHSFTVIHHPQPPGFTYPLPVGLVELDDGPRIIAEIVGADARTLHVGQRVVLEWLDTHPPTGAEPKISLPRFRPNHAAVPAAQAAPPGSHRTPSAAAHGLRHTPGGPRRHRGAGRTAICGIGQTEFSNASGRSELRLAVEACNAAIADAGIDRARVGGLVTFAMDTNPEDQVMRAVGLGELTHFSRVPFGGGGVGGALVLASMAVGSGACEAVLVYRAFNERSGRRFGAGIGDRPPAPTAELVQYSWTSPHGLLTPASWAALIATRMIHERQIDAEDLGHLAVTLRAHAATNPRARFHGRPITLDDYNRARFIAEPFRVFDCCQETDGAVALVVTSVELARHLPSTPVVISAAAQYSTRDLHLSRAGFNRAYTGVDDLAGCARQLWDESGLTPGQIDAAMLYDAFTAPVLAQLSAFGFCAPGGAGEMVRAGELGLGGRLPVNTHGGQIGEAYVHGLNNVTEAVRQLRGDAANQLTAPEHVLVTASGYLPTSAAILSRPGV